MLVWHMINLKWCLALPCIISQVFFVFGNPTICEYAFFGWLLLSSNKWFLEFHWSLVSLKGLKDRLDFSLDRESRWIETKILLVDISFFANHALIKLFLVSQSTLVILLPVNIFLQASRQVLKLLLLTKQFHGACHKWPHPVHYHYGTPVTLLQGCTINALIHINTQ